jgi:Ca2+-binding RTX toxin-like protein
MRRLSLGEGDVMTTYAEILALVASSGTVVDLSDNKTALTVAQAQALVALGVTFSATDAVTVEDEAATVEALTASDIASLDAMGVGSVIGTDRALALDLDQTAALAAADMTVYSEYETMSAASTSSNFLVTQVLTYSVEVVELADGSLLAVHLSRTSSGDYTLVGQSVDANGAPTGDAFTLVEVSGKRVVFFDVAALADGGFAVSWRVNHSTGISTQAFSAAGSALGDATQLTSSDAYQTQVTALSDGGYMVTWLVSSGTYVFHAQRFDASGNAVGSETVLDSDVYLVTPDSTIYESSQVVAMSDGSAMVIWISNNAGSYSVKAQMFDASGAAVDDAFTVSTNVTTYSNTLNAVTLASGDVVITWIQDDATVRFLRYSASGEALGSGTTTVGSGVWIGASDITALDNGGFVVTWTVLSTDGSQESVMMRVYDASGAAVTDATLVNTTEASIEENPKVVALEDGGFVVVWREVTSSSLGLAISAQIYDENGVAIGDELTVSTGVTGSEILDIEPLDNGGFLVTFAVGSSSGSRVMSRVFLPDTDVPTISVTAAELSDLSVSDVADLSELGITSIVVSDGGTVLLGKDAALALSALSGVSLSGAASIHVADAGAALDDLSASNIAALASLGVTQFDASDNAVILSLTQAQAMVSANLAFASGDSVTLSISASDLADLDSADLDKLAAVGVTVLDLSDSASMTYARSVSLQSAGFSVDTGDAIVIADTGDAIEALSAVDIAALASWGVDGIDLTDNAATLTLAAAQALVSAGLTFASDDVVVVSAAASEIAALDASDIAAIAGVGVSSLVSSQAGDLSIGVELALAFKANDVALSASSGDVLVVATGAEVQALSSAEIAKITSLGIKLLDVSDDVVSLTIDQVEVFSAQGMTFSSDDRLELTDASGTAVTVTLTEAQTIIATGLTFSSTYTVTVSLSASALSGLDAEDLGDLAGIGASVFDLTDATSLTYARILVVQTAGFAISADDVVTLADTADVIGALSAADIAALAAWGVDGVDLTDNSATLSVSAALALANAGLEFASSDTLIVSLNTSEMNDLSASDIASIAEIGVSTITFTGSLNLTVAQAEALIDSSITLETADGVIVVSDSGAEITALDDAELGALASLGVTRFDVSDDAVSLTMDQIETLSSSGIVFTFDDKISLLATAAEFAALSAADIAAAADYGVSKVTSSSSTLDVTIAQAAAMQTDSLVFADSLTARLSDTLSNIVALSSTDLADYKTLGVDVVRVSDTGAKIAAMTTANISTLSTLGVDGIYATDGTVTISLVKANALALADIPFDSSNSVAVSASAATFADPDTLDLSGLAAINIDRIDVSDNTISLGYAAAKSYVDAGIGFTSADAVTVALTYADAAAMTSAEGAAFLAANVDTLKTTMTGAQLAAFSAADIATLGGKGVNMIDISDDAATLGTAQAQALVDADISLVSPDAVALADTGANIAALTATDVADIADLGVTSVNASDNVMTLSLTNANALIDNGISLTSDDAITVDLTYAEAMALSASQGAALLAAKVDTIEAVMTGAQLAALSASEIATLGGKDVSVIDLSDNSASLKATQVQALVDADISLVSPDKVALADAGATIASLTTTAIASFADLGVTSVNASDNVITLSLTKVNALIDNAIALTSGDAVTVAFSYSEAKALSTSQGAALLAAKVDTLEANMTGAQAKALTSSQIAAMGASGISMIDLSDNAALLTSVQVKALSAAGIEFDSGDTISVHAAPKLVADTATVAESKTAKVAVLANDTVYDSYELSVSKATVTSGSGVVTIGSDGKLSVRYTGADIDGSEKATVKVSYSATDGVETTKSTLTVTFTAVTEPLVGTDKANKINGSSWDEVIKGLGGADVLHGKGGADTIYGGDGNDRLYGDAGNDVLKGDAGKDRLVGGAGADDLYGGSGADVFLFSSLSDLGKTKAKADEIMDFRHSQGDIIDLSDIDANTKRSGDQDFTFIGTDKYSKTAGELRIDGDKSGYYLHGDINGDGKDDFIIEIHSTTKLVKSDFDL